MKRGFTLIELLVVIAIIGILSSIVMSSVSSQKEKARLKDDPAYEEKYCREKFSDRSIDSIPASCIKYFSVKTPDCPITPITTSKPSIEVCNDMPNRSLREECSDECYNIPNSDGRTRCLKSCDEVPNISLRDRCREELR